MTRNDPARPNVAAILERFPGPVTLRVSRGKWLRVLAGCAVFVIGGVWIARDPAAFAGTGHSHFVERVLVDIGIADDPVSAVEILAIATIVFFGLGLAVALITLLPNAGSLTLGPDGFTVRSLFRTWTCAWRDVRDFAAVSVPAGIRMRRMVGFNFAPGARGLGSDTAQALSGRDGAVPDTYGLTVVELARLMEAWHERAASAPERQQPTGAA